MENYQKGSNDFLPYNLKWLRSSFSMSQESLAKKVGLNRSNIASYENGTCKPKICNLIKIAKYFEVSVQVLTEKKLCQGVFKDFRINKGEDLDVTNYLLMAKEIELVIESLNTCTHHSIKEQGEIADGAKEIWVNYQKLSRLSNQLIENHYQLIEHVKKIK